MKKLTLILIVLCAFITSNAQYTVPRGLPFNDTRFVNYKAPQGFVLFDTLIMFRNIADTQMKPLYASLAYIENFAGDSTFWVWDKVRWKQLGGGGTTQRFGIEDNLGIQNRAVDMQNFSFGLNGASDAFMEATDGGTIFSGVSLDPTQTQLYWQSGSKNTILKLDTSARFYQVDATNTKNLTQFFIKPENLQGEYYVPLSVNGIYSDSLGNIVVPVSGGTLTDISFNNANGFIGNVATSTTTPVLTVSTALTSGSVPFIGFGGALRQNNSNFFWDSTNARLGISTNSPQYNLQVGSPTLGVIDASRVRIATEGVILASNNNSNLNAGMLSLTASASVNAFSFNTGRRSRGTITSPTATQNGDSLYVVGGGGYTGSDWTLRNNADVAMLAAGNYTTSSTPAYIAFEVTNTGEITKREAMDILANRDIQIRNLQSDTTAPTTSGTTKMVITDQDGRLSDISIASAGAITTTYAPLVKSNDSIGLRYSASQYGIIPDGVFSVGASSITSGLNILTCSSCTFTANDVGKYIKVYTAGTSSRDLITTIAGFTNSTTVTLTANAATTATNKDIIYGTDLTAKMQFLTNLVFAQKHGTILWQDGIYIIAGALQTSVGGLNYNSQIYIPTSRANQNPYSKCHIVFEGETPPVMTQSNNPGQTSGFLSWGGTIFYSMQATGASGAAVIGTVGDGTQTFDFSYTYLTVKNIAIVTQNNPAGAGATIGGINYGKGAVIMCDHVAVYTDIQTNLQVYPTNDVAGIETGDNNTETSSRLINTWVCRYKYGTKAGEHLSGDQIENLDCRYGIYPKTIKHAIHLGRVGSYWNQYDVYVGNGSTYMSIDLLNIEADTLAADWEKNLNTIRDTANAGHGTIYYHIVNHSAGVEGSLFSHEGGWNFNYFLQENRLPSWTRQNTWDSLNTFSNNIVVTGTATLNGATSVYNIDITPSDSTFQIANTKFVKQAVISGISGAYTASNGITLTGINFTNDLNTGKSGGQTATGGTASAEGLKLQSTTNGTKGNIFLGNDNQSYYWEAQHVLTLGNPNVAANQTTAIADGLILQDTTPATNGAQKYSPAIHLLGRTWTTAAGGSSVVTEGKMQLLGVQSASPTLEWDWLGQVNGGGWGSVMMKLTGSGSSSTLTTLTGLTNGSILLNGNTVTGMANMQVPPLNILNSAGNIQFMKIDGTTLQTVEIQRAGVFSQHTQFSVNRQPPVLTFSGTNGLATGTATNAAIYWRIGEVITTASSTPQTRRITALSGNNVTFDANSNQTGGFTATPTGSLVSSLSVIDNGLIGIGTWTPTAHLDIVNTTHEYAPLRLEQDSLATGGLINSGNIETDILTKQLFYTPNSAQYMVGIWGYVSKSASYTATNDDYTIEVTGTGKVITLPTAVGITGRVYIIKCTNASGADTVATTSSQNIDAATTYILATQYKYVTVQSNGANWIVIANNGIDMWVIIMIAPTVLFTRKRKRFYQSVKQAA